MVLPLIIISCDHRVKILMYLSMMMLVNYLLTKEQTSIAMHNKLMEKCYLFSFTFYIKEQKKHIFLNCIKMVENEAIQGKTLT